VLCFQKKKGVFVMSIAGIVAKRARRYTVVRIISRGGDYIISTVLITLYGDTWFLPIVALASIFNVTVDYAGQKLWAFEQTPKKRKRFFKEAILYGIIRGMFGLMGFGSVVVLYFYLDVPYAISALIVTIALWFAAYPISTLLFVGSSRGLPPCVRTRWIAARKRARS
jgi:uncharacterized membrane protein YfcA